MTERERRSIERIINDADLWAQDAPEKAIGLLADALREVLRLIPTTPERGPHDDGA